MAKELYSGAAQVSISNIWTSVLVKPHSRRRFSSSARRWVLTSDECDGHVEMPTCTAAGCPSRTNFLAPARCLVAAARTEEGGEEWDRDESEGSSDDCRENLRVAHAHLVLLDAHLRLDGPHVALAILVHGPAQPRLRLDHRHLVVLRHQEVGAG
ncbi:hypothetical protein T492DRAFT_1050677 [Pavlovales sp. CCMP2436]|nr:hypothetical protein T492DRAFT_1050677 [Pavlovales sp. CCMP2436]